MALSVTQEFIGTVPVFRTTPLSGVAAIGDGTWFSMAGCRAFSVHVSGIGTATVIVTGSNALTEPAPATHGIVLATMTADSIVNVAMPVRWVKVRVSAWTSGTISAWVEGLAEA